MGVSSKVSDAFSINEAGKVNEESELQLANALKPKDSTVDGSLTVFKAVQFSKVLRRMLVISQSLSNVAVSKAVQLLNTPLPKQGFPPFSVLRILQKHNRQDSLPMRGW